MATETEGKMNAFLGAFPDVESRHSAAIQLADPTGLPLPDASHPSWNFLAAHWGDPEEELRAIGGFAWNLYNDLPVEGGPVAIITRGTAEGLFAPKAELDDDIKLTAGVVVEKELLYGYAGYLTSRGPSRMGIRPPYLAFGLRLRLIDPVEITAGMLGEYSATRSDSRFQDVSVHFGVVSLSEDLHDYQAKRKIAQREVLIGRVDCGRAEDAIREKTRATSEPLY